MTNYNILIFLITLTGRDIGIFGNIWKMQWIWSRSSLVWKSTTLCKARGDLGLSLYRLEFLGSSPIFFLFWYLLAPTNSMRRKMLKEVIIIFYSNRHCIKLTLAGNISYCLKNDFSEDSSKHILEYDWYHLIWF